MATNTGTVGKSEAPPEAREVKLGKSELDELVTKKATCPFLGSAIATEKLPVHVHAGNPLASVQRVIELGNTGGGDLGKVLGFFARGNHGKMPGRTGNFDAPVPNGMFSLDLPGSQGSHAGHSGILQGDPTQLDSGRFSDEDFKRLVNKSRPPDERLGFIKRSDIARFIAENVDRDPSSKFFPIEQWAREVADLSQALVRRLVSRGEDDTVDMEILQSITSLMGSNNLLGSAGEFGLLLAFLHNSPRTRRRGADLAFSMAEITAMFKDKKLPDDWETWEKTFGDWLLHTIKLASRAVAELSQRRV